MRWKAGGQRRLISASEIASFAYCPEAWRLEHALGLDADNDAARQDGRRHHARKAAAERLAGGLLLLGRLLAVLTAVALLLLVWRWL